MPLSNRADRVVEKITDPGIENRSIFNRSPIPEWTTRNFIKRPPTVGKRDLSERPPELGLRKRVTKPEERPPTQDIKLPLAERNSGMNMT